MGFRDISDDNDEVKDLSDFTGRDLKVRFGEGYPYTYPFYYATGELRAISDPGA